MADIPPGVIPVSQYEFDKLYPRYQLEAAPGVTFQQWLRQQQDTSKPNEAIADK